MDSSNKNSPDLSALLMSAPPLSFELNREGVVLWVSYSLAKSLSKNIDTFLGLEMEDVVSQLLTPEYQIQAENSIYKVLQEVDLSAKFSGLVKGGNDQQVFDFSVAPTQDGGVVVVGALSENTQSYASQLEEVREAQTQLTEEKERLEALFEVGKALQSNLDPSLVALKGLRALLAATKSDSGIVFFYDQASDRFEIVAIHGIPENNLAEVERLVNGNSIARYCIQKRESVRVDNIKTDERAVIRAANIEGINSAVISPMIVGNRALGSISIFRKEVKAYREADVSLVAAAASQIAAATSQAELYANERKQAGYFAALYRLSHELSGHLSMKEISQRAFHVINRELACKRMWLGTLNEQGSHLVGQAGFGPGVRKQIISAHIEIDRTSENPLVQCLSRKEPVIISGKEWRSCKALGEITSKLNLETCALIPLVSMAQSIGVLVVEPAGGAGFFNHQKLSFLGSMASEIAVVLLANKFQSKVAEADKMRMAGLFASAIAHNFNNMLQVIMGQASLIEMQEESSSGVSEAAALIKSASIKGASLVKQLLNYSATDLVKAENLNAKEVIEGSRDLYKAILGSNVTLKINYHSEDIRISFDRNQLQQVVSNILVNAREAFADGSGNVQIDIAKTVLRSGEVDPELIPGRYVRIDIRDDGAGMSDEVKSRCFEPFFTTKNTDPTTGIGVAGSGLGLSTVYSIIKKNHGTITVDSSEFAGSAFSIYLPEVVAADNKVAASEFYPEIDSEVSHGSLSEEDEVVPPRHPKELN